ncbi:hypothetical protein ACFL2H_00545 [Planctomycetota bacterium]
MLRDHSLGDGVYYAEADYPGILRRVAIWLIDSLVLFVVAIIFWNTVLRIFWDAKPSYRPILVFFATYLFVVWGYLFVGRAAST